MKRSVKQKIGVIGYVKKIFVEKNPSVKVIVKGIQEDHILKRIQ